MTTFRRKRNEKEVYKGYILIVCEGEKTEPSYFKCFKKHFPRRHGSWEIQTVGTGTSDRRLIIEAKQAQINLMKDKKCSKQDIEVWCVFDADPKPHDPNKIDDFNTAINIDAPKAGFHVAYSHQAFEYWFLLHFHNHNGSSMNRNDYEGRLNGCLKPKGIKYGKNEADIELLFSLLISEDNTTGKIRQNLAIERARKIQGYWEGINPHRNTPGAEESSTTVHLLIERLLKDVA